MRANIANRLIMGKILLLLSTIFLFNGCAESIALIGTSTSNGRIVQSSLNSAISYGIKKHTGKTPLEHAVAYAEEINPEKKEETCFASFDITKSEFCAIVKKQISLSNDALIKKTKEVVKKYPTNNFTKEISKIEKIAKKSAIYNRR